jgi:hypothetical protein
MAAKVKIDGVEAISITDIPDKDKDAFGYPLGTLWQRVNGAGMFFKPKTRGKVQ